MERYLQTEEKEKELFPPLALDPETFNILSSDPELLLQEMFRGKPEKTFLLRGSGFKMDRQLLRWQVKYREGLEENIPIHIIMNEFLEETVQDVVGFYYEYQSGQDIFKIDVEIKKNSEGKRDVFASKYNTTLREVNKKLKEVTGIEEREGALEEGVEKAIEAIIKSGPNTVVFINSPKGWNGMTEKGYPDNQTYVYWINSEGNLTGTTIRTDINLEASEKLTGKNTENLQKSVKERIKNVVSSPVIFSANSVEVVLDLIEEASGRKFEKQRQELQKREDLFTLNEKASQIITRLRNDLTAKISHLSKDNIQEFVILVGKSILDLEQQVLEEEESLLITSIYPSTNIYDNLYPEIAMYEYLEQRVRQLEGCNGGGLSSNQTMTESFEYISTMTEGTKTLNCKCPFCGCQVNALIFGGRITCPECGSSATYNC